MQHRDFVKAAKELNDKAKTTIKVVAVKGDVLKKSIKTTVESLTDFDFSILAPETLDVFDELKCVINEEKVIGQGETELIEENLVDDSTPPKDNVIPIDKTETKERTIHQQGPAMIAAATDLIDFLGFPASALKKFEDLDLVKMVNELQKMADEINQPYLEDDGKTVTPQDKPDDFKSETVAVFEANNITVNWGEEKKETDKKETKYSLEVKKETKPIKGKKVDKKDKPVVKKEDKPVKEKKIPKEKKYSRIDAFCDVMKEKKPLTKTEIIKQMVDKYDKNHKLDQTGRLHQLLTPLVELSFVIVKETEKETTYCIK